MSRSVGIASDNATKNSRDKLIAEISILRKGRSILAGKVDGVYTRARIVCRGDSALDRVLNHIVARFATAVRRSFNEGGSRAGWLTPRLPLVAK